MDDFKMTLAIRWLDAEAAFAASCLSSEWRAIFATDSAGIRALWKQVFVNTFPVLAESMADDTNMDYRLLTLGLWKGRTPITAETPRYTPTLRPEDFFAVVELNWKSPRRNGKKMPKKVLASWICPMNVTHPDFGGLIVKEFDKHDENMQLKVPNPYSESMQDSNAVRASLAANGRLV